MLIELWSPAFKENGVVRPIIKFEEGLNVILGTNDGSMSIGKSSALLAIDFAFGGNTYIKSDGVEKEGHHVVFFAFEFDGIKTRFARSTKDPDRVFICDDSYKVTGSTWSKSDFIEWLQKGYHMDFEGLSFRIAMSSYFRIYGKSNTNELNPLQGIPGQGKGDIINSILALFDRRESIIDFENQLENKKARLAAYKTARKYDFVSNLVGGKAKYEENISMIGELELQLETLKEKADSSNPNEDIEKNKRKADLTTSKLRYESEIRSLERKLKLVNLSLEYGLAPTEADLNSLQEFFPAANIRKIYEVEQYHRKLAKILDAQFANEKKALEKEIIEYKEMLDVVNKEINELGFVGNLSRDFLDRYSELTNTINALKTQNEAFLKLRELEKAKSDADAVLQKNIESVLEKTEIELNSKMRDINSVLFKSPRKPPQIHFLDHNRFTFDTPDDTGTGSNYKGMVVFDLAMLECSALPALAHDSLLFKNWEKSVEDGIIREYARSKKQIFIAFDKQGDCSPSTRKILEDKAMLRLGTDGKELYGRCWNKEETD